MNIITTWKSPNFSLGRKKKIGQAEQILAIVNHITGGQYPGCRSWLCNPQAQASAHYIVNRTGEIIQIVDDKDTAWHAGIVNKPNWTLYNQMQYNPNRWTIGIEHEGYDGALTEEQYQATLELHRMLIAKYNIPINNEHIVGHYRVDSVNRPYCPGPNFPWARLFQDLKNGGGEVIDFKDMDRVRVVVDGVERTDCGLITVEGRATTFIPAIALRESGHSVEWDGEKVIIETKGDK